MGQKSKEYIICRIVQKEYYQVQMYLVFFQSAAFGPLPQLYLVHFILDGQLQLIDASYLRHPYYDF